MLNIQILNLQQIFALLQSIHEPHAIHEA